jgi:ligand-binding sensor domain-containing protein/serine phosphatase RsbU (regulator of sigma subunit)
MRTRSVILSLCLLVLLIFQGFSQSVNIKRFNIEQGLSHPSVYSIIQDKTGFIWLCTGVGLNRFDGTTFASTFMGDSLPNTVASANFQSSKDSLWFGFDDGSLYLYSKRKFVKKYSNQQSPSTITCLTKDGNGNILACTQNNGIILITPEKTEVLPGTNDKLIYSIVNTGNNNFLVGTSSGIWEAKLEASKSEFIFRNCIKTIAQTKIQCIVSYGQDKYLIGTEDEGVSLLQYNAKSLNAQKLTNDPVLMFANVQSIQLDDNNNIWLATFGNGLYKLINKNNTFEIAENYNESNGLGDNYIKSIYFDREKDLWVGTYSSGLSAIINESFVFYNFTKEGINNNILSIASTKEGVYFGSRQELSFMSAKTKQITTLTAKNGLPADNISAILPLENNQLYFGTEKNGVYLLNVQTKQVSSVFRSSNSVENKINYLAFANNTLWIATNGGIIKIDKNVGRTEKFSMDNGLPHNKINSLFIEADGSIWIATKSNGLVSLNSKKHFKMEGIPEIEFTGIAADKKGNLWASTYGDGIFCFRKDSVIHLSENEGLKSDYGYSIVADPDGNLWTGHRMGLSRINCTTYKVLTYGIELGIRGDCNLNATNIASDGILRFGTTDGIVQYNYSSGKQKLLPPNVDLVSVRIGDKEFDFSKPIVLPYGKYRVRFDFVGLNFTNPAGVKYQYKLEGWENDWSEISSNTFALYPRVDDGNFTFLVRAYNAEGIANEIPFSITVKIRAPFWKQWWFIILSIIALVAAVYAIIKYREQKQIAFQKHLQKLLDERTREVVEQKEEIETKNRDITDSITYAQRIQTSILPSIKKLQDSFSGCFIFYQPRDIVSGDFYWFDKVTDTKFSIVCGDSTGHGVPGALMSMIGTTLIKDICTRPDVVKPSDVLLKLDEEMANTLNQNFDAEKSSDGMDIIACEIDVESYMVRIASAMRPVILYQNGEQIYVQGSKNSIGGSEFGDEGKLFDDNTYQLQKGDIIYMFSDGYPDQFGGPMGKKFKMIRLRNMLRDIHELPMEEQYLHVKNTFNLWRDQLEQVDDVLFMGIKI